MIKLIESGLFGSGLIPIDSPNMVQRYNECLDDIGLRRTELPHFHIDGWGWSPEIAEEQGNQLYLSHGSANPYGIIITPEQADSSLYFPIHSFDWDIHSEIFRQYGAQINDITAQCGLWFELDQSIVAYRAAQDLLMVETIQIQFKSVDGLMEAAREQRALVSRFYDESSAWADSTLRNDIIESGKKYGDLRFRKVEIPGFPYTKIQSFYSSAFGGVYVLKDMLLAKPLLILEDNSSAVSGQMQHGHIEFNLDDPRLLGFLYGQHLIVDQMDFFKLHPNILEHQLNVRLMRAASEAKPDLHLNGLNNSKKKGLINELYSSGLLDEEFLEFEQFVRKLQNKEELELPARTALRNEFLHPDPALDPTAKAVLWQLLNRLLKRNEVLAYTFDKVAFYHRYKEWKPAYQDWVIAEIQKNKGIYNKIM